MMKKNRLFLNNLRKMKRINIKMTSDEFNDLNNLSNKLGKSKSNIIKEALSIYKDLGGDLDEY